MSMDEKIGFMKMGGSIQVLKRKLPTKTTTVNGHWHHIEHNQSGGIESLGPEMNDNFDFLSNNESDDKDHPIINGTILKAEDGHVHEADPESGRRRGEL